MLEYALTFINLNIRLNRKLEKSKRNISFYEKSLKLKTHTCLGYNKKTLKEKIKSEKANINLINGFIQRLEKVMISLIVDKNLIIEIIEYDPFIINCIEGKLKDDKDIYMTAAKKNILAFDTLNYGMITNKDILDEIIKQKEPIWRFNINNSILSVDYAIKFLSYNILNYSHFPPLIKKNINVITFVLEHDMKYFFRYEPLPLIRQQEIIQIIKKPSILNQLILLNHTFDFVNMNIDSIPKPLLNGHIYWFIKTTIDMKILNRKIISNNNFIKRKIILLFLCFNRIMKIYLPKLCFDSILDCFRIKDFFNPFNRNLNINKNNKRKLETTTNKNKKRKIKK